MRIAFVSFEYAGVAQGGGIGTYVRNTSEMLAARGHEVEIFAAAESRMGMPPPGVRLHPIVGARDNFSANVLSSFLCRHEALPFDVVEASEFGADIDLIIDAVPELPRVVKLATASFQIAKINEEYLGLGAKVRFLAGALRRGRYPRPFWGRYDETADPERRITLAADEVTSPSRALLDHTSRTWPIDRTRSAVIPHFFRCSPELLALDPSRVAKWITFIGKLEVRKGVLELAQAIPAILEVIPEARFRFVGQNLPHPATHENLAAAVARLAGASAAGSIEFTGAVPYDRIPKILADFAIGVFPSNWEAYGFVCVEAMAAGCGVVGSAAGGMAEIIDDGRTGLLVPPRDPRAIAEAVITLLRDPMRRSAMGRAAREHVCQAYSANVIGPLQEASYSRAIDHARMRCRAMAIDTHACGWTRNVTPKKKDC